MTEKNLCMKKAPVKTQLTCDYQGAKDLDQARLLQVLISVPRGPQDGSVFPLRTDAVYSIGRRR